MQTAQWLHTSSNRVQLSGNDRDIPLHKHKSRHVAKKDQKDVTHKKQTVWLRGDRGLLNQSSSAIFTALLFMRQTKEKEKRKEK